MALCKNVDFTTKTSRYYYCKCIITFYKSKKDNRIKMTNKESVEYSKIQKACVCCQEMDKIICKIMYT